MLAPRLNSALSVISSELGSEFIETRLDFVCSLRMKSELSLVVLLAECGVESPKTTFLNWLPSRDSSILLENLLKKHFPHHLLLKLNCL